MNQHPDDTGDNNIPMNESSEGKRIQGRGHWLDFVYLPVLLIRWILVPHRDWMAEHKHRQEEMNAHAHHHHHHHHHHHAPDHVPEDVQPLPECDVGVMDAYFGQ